MPEASSVSKMINEAWITQNPALGAAIIWRSACGYQAANKLSASIPLPVAFTVVPLIFTKGLFDVLSRTHKDSGLRKFCEKFAETKDAKQDLLLSLHDRCLRWRDISWASLRQAFSGRLLTLTQDGLLVPLTETSPRGVPAKSAALLRNAEKLGGWYGGVSIHEVSTLLKIRF